MTRQLHTTKGIRAEIPSESKEATPPITAEVGRVIVAHLIYSADDRETERFRLASDNDTDRHPNDPITKRSISSPLGKSVLKKEAGDDAFSITPEGAVVGVEIRSIEQPEDTQKP